MYGENESCCVYFAFVCILNVTEKSDKGKKVYTRENSLTTQPRVQLRHNLDIYFTYIV